MSVAARKPKKSKPIYERGARVVSVFGPFASRALIEMPVEVAAELFDGRPLSGSGRTSVVEATERDLASLRELDEALADSAFAASALALAYEIEHPFNSATSKSMCARAHREAMTQLRELAPAEKEDDFVDEFSRRLAEKRASGGAGT